jgi:uncharacterized membrane protein
MISQWLAYAAMGSVVRRSLKVSLIVGTLIGLINYSDRFFADAMTSRDWFKVVVTYVVPYLVSTYAAVSAIIAMHREATSAKPD